MSFSGDILQELRQSHLEGGDCPFMVKARLRNKFSELSTPRALHLAMCSCLPPTASSSVHLQQEQSESCCSQAGLSSEL